MGDFQGKLFVLMLRLLAWLPLVWCWQLAKLIGSIMWLNNGRARRTTEINIQLCYPQLDREQQRQISRQSLVESSKLLTEMAAMWMWPLDRSLALIKRSCGEQLLEQASQSDQGIIILAPHIGNWELLGMYLGRHYQVTNLYQPPTSPILDQLLQSVRTRSGGDLVPTNRSGISALLTTLKKGGMVGILPDQEPEPESGIFAPFFGVPALTMTLVSNLVKKTGAQVFCAYAKRLETEKGFELVFKPADEAIACTDIEESVKAINRSVESCVVDVPEQYQWEYKRFKKRPQEQQRFYPKGK